MRPQTLPLKTKKLTALAVSFLFLNLAEAYDGKPAPEVANVKPAQIQDVGIDEQLGKNLDLNLKFKDEKGQDVTLGSYVDGKLPVIISPVYYSCPGLCNFHLNGLTDALKLLDWSPGAKFKVLAISFDFKEGPELAAAKKETYMKVYDRPGTEEGWTFLTADEANVQAFTKALGFKFRWDEASQEWAHAAAAVIVSPQGKITRYLPGIMFDPKDVKLALNEASAGKIGTFVDSLVLYCFKYDPHQSKYALYAFNLVKLGGAVMVLVLAIWLLPVWIRARRSGKDQTARS